MRTSFVGNVCKGPVEIPGGSLGVYLKKVDNWPMSQPPITMSGELLPLLLISKAQKTVGLRKMNSQLAQKCQRPP